MTKDEVRQRVWDALEESGEARFPFPPHGRIPNFAGADRAAELLTETPVWGSAEVIKTNPDSPQRPVRRRALAAGKTVYMAVPRLRDEACFLRLDPDEIEDIDHATTIGGSSEVGEPVDPMAVELIDLIVAGSVAVTAAGDRIGKGEGYSDLEFAILRECDRVTGETPTVTTVHELQVIPDTIATAPYDVPMDRIVTPERSLGLHPPREKPSGVLWSEVSDGQRREIPILSWLADR